MDWEKDCKKCGMCCTACFVVDGKHTRPKKLICKYIADDNTCMVYKNRKDVVGCAAADEIKHCLPIGCAFGGTAEVTSGDELFITPPKQLVGVLLSGVFKWRYA